MKVSPILLSAHLVVVALSCQLVCDAKEPATRSFSWKQTESSIALLNQDRAVWRLVYDPKQNKSYFHPLSLVDGTMLTELRPADHVWHYAGWFSWKFINGLNYWEEDRQTGLPGGISEITSVKVHPGDDFSARIEMTLSYHPPGKAEVLAEKRTLTASAPDAAGSYHIDWRSEFAAKGNKVVLDRTPLPGQLGGAGHGGYAGLSIRVAKANVPWNFLDSEGRVNDSHGKQARWLNHSGEIADGREAGLTMFDHPDNVGHPSRWFTVRGMPYFSPAVIFSNPLTLDSDEKLDLRYRILVQARKGTTAELDRQHARFVGTLSAKSNNPNSTKHVHTLAPKPSLEKRPVPPGFERLDHVIHVGVQKGKLRYKVEEFTVKPGSRVKVVLANTDDMQHNILFCKPGSGVALAVAQKAWMMGAAAMEKQFVPEDDRVLFASRIVGVGETDEIYFVAPDKEADYPYVCSLPGHAFTMKGVMTVTEKETTPHPKPDQEQPVYVDYDVVVKDCPLVYRVILDGASPRTISIGLPEGYNYVFNPVTCEVEFVWLGGFINLRGERTGRGNGTNTILGPRYETGSRPFPLRVGSLGTEPQSIVFGGYLRTGLQNPVFYYEVDEVHVEQELRFAKEGKQIHYRFKTHGAKDPVHFIVDETEVASLSGSAGRWNSGALTLSPDEAGSFSVVVDLKGTFPSHKDRTVTPGPAGLNPAKPEEKGESVRNKADEAYSVAVPQPQPDILPAGYHVETMVTPSDDAGKPLQFEVGGIDFSADGTAFIASRVAGIWKYKDGCWSLFADGLHDPLGILVSADGRNAYVTQKPELTLVQDLDGDGVADEYKTICDKWKFAGNYCEYVHGLVRDKGGSFYFTLNLADGGGANTSGPKVEKAGGAAMGTTFGYDGWAIQVTARNQFVPFAYGLRSPAGIGISPNDELFFTDNQGGWIGTSTLNHLVKDTFYGYPASMLDLPEYKAGKKLDYDEFAKLRKPPAIWIPHNELANSPGNPHFDDTGGKFGPFQGQIFIGDQTKSNILRVGLEKVQGEYQGCVFNFIDHLQSGCIRIRFDQRGRLWVGQTGRGWASVGGKLEGLQRITWDGKTIPFEIHSMKLTRTGFKVRFTKPLNREIARRPSSFHFKHWHYLYHGKYGSPKIGTQDVKPRLRSISKDGKTVQLDLPLVKGEVYQLITHNLLSENGSSLSTPTGYYTLNNLLN